tara:strand:+ start:5196 stop:5762 length:567 start_codon:yes stop_codon:yes gene_type:complete
MSKIPMSNELKPISVIAVIALILLAPSIRDALREEAATYVSDSESSHDGLPESWNNSQVMCVMFPSDTPHPEFNSGVTMIESDGSTYGANSEFNGTGVCVGGFTGFTEGMTFFLNSTNATNGVLDVSYDVTDWGPYVHTIGGLNANELTGNFSGAYWELLHNGEISMVGIGDLIMSEGDVLLWRIATW